MAPKCRGLRNRLLMLRQKGPGPLFQNVAAGTCAKGPGNFYAPGMPGSGPQPLSAIALDPTSIQVRFTQCVSIGAVTGVEYQVNGGAWTAVTSVLKVSDTVWDFTITTPTIDLGDSVDWRYLGGSDSIVDCEEAVDVGEQQIPVLVPAVLAIACGTAPNGIIGVPYSHQVTASGGWTPIAYSEVTPWLPAWATLNASTGEITGTPDAAATSNGDIRATDAQSNTDDCNLSISTYAALNITTTSLPDGVVGQAYSQTLQATGGDGSYTWSIISGSLPPGLSLNESTGEISGTPTGNITANFMVQCLSGDGQTDTQALSITTAELSVWVRDYETTPALGDDATFVRASEGTVFDDQAVLKTAAIDEARFYGHPFQGGAATSGLRGLWMEPAITNLMPYSSDYSQYDLLNGPTINQNQTGMDGVSNAATIIDSQIDGDARIEYKHSIPASDQERYTAVFCVKADTDQTRFPEFAMNLTDGGVNANCYAQLNTETGASVIRSSSQSPLIASKKVGDWWLFAVSNVNNSNHPNVQYVIRPAVSTTWGTYESAATGSVVVHHVQLFRDTTPDEALTRSIIPTTGVAATKAEDTLSYVNVGIPNTTVFTVDEVAQAPIDDWDGVVAVDGIIQKIEVTLG